MHQHVIQSPEWGRFKTEYGTTSHTAGKIQYTTHEIPLTNYRFAYAPKISSFDINWDELKGSLIKNRCVAINFDVPDIIKGSSDETKALEKITKVGLRKSPRDTFAKYNVLLDIARPEEELLSRLHTKHRYNLRYAQKQGVTIELAESLEDFEKFYTLFAQTAVRQKYYIHPKPYYEKIWKIFKPLDIAHIVTAIHNEIPIASWMLFTYKHVVYYPYGGSDENYKNLQASTLVGWEAIKLGKSMDCTLFDMWGAAKDPENKKDSWYGFTNFKLRFGGTHVEYMDSYDFVINDVYYNAFNTANNLRWKLLKLKKLI